MQFFFALLVIFIVASLAYISFLLRSDPQLANAYVAVSTLILALATVLLAGFTGLSIRSGEKREQRDRRERLLNEIIEWALEATRAAIFRQTITSDELWSTRLKYKYSISRGKYIERIVLSSFPSLLSLFNSIISELDNALLTTQKFAEHNAAKSDLLNCEKQVAESVEKLIKEATKIKASL